MSSAFFRLQFPARERFRLKKHRRFSRALFVAIAVSIVLHTLPVAYLVSSRNLPLAAKVHEIEVELLGANKTSKAQLPKMSQPKVHAADRRTDLGANIFSGGFSQHQLDVLASAETDVQPAATIGSMNAIADPFPSDPMTNVQAAGHGWSTTVQYGNSMGLKFTLESLHFFQALHARINSQLVYPEDFSKQRITGKVRIEAELGADGRLIRFTSTMADDRLLQTYCFAVLMQILSQPLPQRAWLETKTTLVAFDFEFHTRIRNNIPRTLPLAIEKNRLSFGRESEIDPWLNERLNEIFTHYIPPIIPIPGGFYIDMVAAYTYVNNLLNDVPVEREARGERLTKLHELLRMTLKVNGVLPAPMPTPPES